MADSPATRRIVLSIRRSAHPPHKQQPKCHPIRSTPSPFLMAHLFHTGSFFPRRGPRPLFFNFPDRGPLCPQNNSMVRKLNFFVRDLSLRRSFECSFSLQTRNCVFSASGFFFSGTWHPPPYFSIFFQNFRIWSSNIEILLVRENISRMTYNFSPPPLPFPESPKPPG